MSPSPPRRAKRTRRNYSLWFRRIHKWLALIVGIQLIMWTMSGLFMSYVPLEEVHGDHLWRKNAPPIPVTPGEVSYGVENVLSRYGAQAVTDLRLFSRNGRALYEVKTGAATLYLDAGDGTEVGPIAEPEAIAIARAAYRGSGAYRSSEYVTNPDLYGEIRGRPLPIWKINFDDFIDSSLYVSPELGRVITVRSDIWRAFDFFWMLHIMDYDKREDFNSPLLIFAASLALFVSLSGLMLIFYAFSKKDFRWLRRQRPPR